MKSLEEYENAMISYFVHLKFSNLKNSNILTEKEIIFLDKLISSNDIENLKVADGILTGKKHEK